MGVLCVDCLKRAQAEQRPLRSRLGFTAALGRPYVTYALIALNVAVYVVGLAVLGGAWAGYLALWPGYTEAAGFVYADVGNEWWRWVTAGFTHFGIFHIAMNMFVLWQLGHTLEPAMGRLRFLGLYAASLLGSSAGVMLLSNSGAHAGASGAIFGLLAAYGIVLRRLRLPYQSVLVISALFIGGPFLAEFVPVLSIFGALSWQGHLGGAVVGAVVMLLMLRGVDRRTARSRA